MSSLRIAFDASTKSNFRWFDSFEGLKDEELEGFAIQCRNAATAFVTELSHRRNPRKDHTLEQYHDMLLANADRINSRGLDDDDEVDLKNSSIYLADPREVHTQRSEERVARQYLWLVSRVIGSSYALLILRALGKHRVHKLGENQRVKLIKYIVQHRRSLSCPRLRDKAIEYNLQDLHVTVDIPLSKGRKGRKHESIEGPREDASMHVSYESTTADNEVETTQLEGRPSWKRQRIQSDTSADLVPNPEQDQSLHLSNNGIIVGADISTSGLDATGAIDGISTGAESMVSSDTINSLLSHAQVLRAPFLCKNNLDGSSNHVESSRLVQVRRAPFFSSCNLDGSSTPQQLQSYDQVSVAPFIPAYDMDKHGSSPDILNQLSMPTASFPLSQSSISYSNYTNDGQSAKEQRALFTVSQETAAPSLSAPQLGALGDAREAQVMGHSHATLYQTSQVIP